MATTNGRSERTPTKMDLFFLLADYSADRSKQDGKKLVIVDVTGGDGDWSLGHSSEVYAAMVNEGVTVDIHVIEKNRKTFKELCTNLSFYLQDAGWGEEADNQWSFGRSRFTAWHGDANAVLARLPITEHDRLLLIHDPNTIEGYALDPSREKLAAMPPRGSNENFNQFTTVARDRGFWNLIPTLDVTVVHSLGRGQGVIKEYLRVDNNKVFQNATTEAGRQRLGRSIGHKTGRDVWDMFFHHILRHKPPTHDVFMIYLPQRGANGRKAPVHAWIYVVVSVPGTWDLQVPGIFAGEDATMAWHKEDPDTIAWILEQYVDPADSKRKLRRTPK
jgi:hypothetical protein